MILQIQHFEADFLWKVSLKILNSGIILKTFTHEYSKYLASLSVQAERSGSVGRVIDWPAESLCCVLEQDALSAAYWFNLGRTEKLLTGT